MSLATLVALLLSLGADAPGAGVPGAGGPGAGALGAGVLGAAALSADDAVAWALTRNRELIAARLDVDEAAVLAVTASIWSNPELAYSAGNVVLGGGNREHADVRPRPLDEVVQTVALSQTFDVWGKRGQRRRAAAGAADAARLRVQEAVRQVRFAVRTAHAEVVREQSELALAAQMRARYVDTVALSRKRYAAGEASATALHKIELETLHYDNEVALAESELAAARLRLAALLALDSAAALPPELVQVGAPPAAVDVSLLIARAQAGRPDMAALRAELAAAQATVAVATRDAFVDPTLQLTYEHSHFVAGGDNPDTLTLGIGLPLPLFERNQAARGVAAVAVRRVELQLAAGATAVAHEVAHAAIVLARAHAMVQRFEGTMLAYATEARDVADRQFRAGALSLLELLEAQRTYLATRADYVRSVYDWRQAAIAVAFAAGDETIATVAHEEAS